MDGYGSAIAPSTEGTPDGLCAFIDLSPPTTTFKQDVIDGLASDPPCLSPKYFYDDLGSLLFEAICRTPEYYVTRTERALLDTCLPPIARRVGANATVLEYGAGAQTKTLSLLRGIDRPAGVVAVDIAGVFLRQACIDLAGRLREDADNGIGPEIPVTALHADFTTLEHLPDDLSPFGAGGFLGFMPGSTIGNFSPSEAEAFLRHVHAHVGATGQFLIGVDLRKSPERLEAAYDDAGGVTAAFNRNILVRMKRELGAFLDPAGFRHEARWNELLSRVEMHLVAVGPQTITVDENSYHFADGQSIHSENAYKYSIDGFQSMARRAGFHANGVWSDPEALFSLHLLKTQ